MSPEEQFEILNRGTEEILPEGALLERLQSAAREKRPLRVKQGFDPTAQSSSNPSFGRDAMPRPF